MAMLNCKRCGSERLTKNGMVRGKLRHKCKDCGLNFVEGDRRVKDSLAAKKALAVILYSVGKASFGMLGKLFGHSRSLMYRWITEAAASLPDPEVAGGIQEMEFDEMWRFVGSKKTSAGPSRPWIVAHGALLPGWSVVVILQPLEGATTRSST